MPRPAEVFMPETPDKPIPVLKLDKDIERRDELQPQADATTRKLYEELAPSVVKILSNKGKVKGSGSGFFVDDDGHVITDAHVAYPGVELKVVDYRGEQYRARIEKLDDINDLAVLKVEGAKKGAFKPLSLGRSDGLVPDRD